MTDIIPQLYVWGHHLKISHLYNWQLELRVISFIMVLTVTVILDG